MHRLEGGAFGSKLVQLLFVTHGVWKVRHGIEIEKQCVQRGILGDLTIFVSRIDNYDIFT